jgi:hypothetical protein
MKQLIRTLSFTTVTLAALAVGAAFAAESDLSAADGSGVPEGYDRQAWMQASGQARVVEQIDGEDVVVLQAEGLVPDGIYTVWWVNERLVGMDMGPGGGLPQNTFTADHEGNAEARLTVDSGHGYEMMVIAYHADHRTHGEHPGEMGEVSFEHLKGAWPADDES